jgi:diacylglycerol O-acyltransferase
VARKVDSRMGVFDAVMWGVESDPLLRSVVTLVVILDKAPDHAILTQRVEEMSIRVPALRRRVVGNPVSLVPPRWEPLEDFDLGYHLRWRKATNTRDESHVMDVAEHLTEMDFDRARPLWEVIVVEGLTDGTTAVVMKIHHAITDGVGGMAMAASLFDLTSDPSKAIEPEAPHVAETGQGSRRDRLLDGTEYSAKLAVGQVKSAAGNARNVVTGAVTHPVGTVKSSVDFTSSAARVLAPASTPMSPVMRGRSLGVHFAVLEAPLDALEQAGDRNGGGLNDAYMAVVSGAIARYHATHGVSLEEAPAIRINMPVNLRAPGSTPATGNRWIPARFPLPLGPVDPVERIRELHPILSQAETEPALEISEPIFRLLTSLPRPATTALAAGMMKGTDVAATNVPGPPKAVFLAGAQVEKLLPFAPKGGAAMNLAMVSYDGKAEIAVNIDTAAIYDHDVMVRCLAETLEEVVKLGE